MTLHWIDFPSPDRKNLVVEAPGVTEPGAYAFAVHVIGVGNTLDQRQWSAPFTVRVIPCQESVKTGVFTLTPADGILYEPYGISSSSAGLASGGIQFCQSDRPRTLRVSAESGTTDTGTSVPRPEVGFGLYYALQYPLDTSGFLRAEDLPNAREVASSEHGILTWVVAPGLYRLFFFQGPLMTTPVFGGLSPHLAVTYRLEIDPAVP